MKFPFDPITRRISRVILITSIVCACARVEKKTASFSFQTFCRTLDYICTACKVECVPFDALKTVIRTTST